MDIERKREIARNWAKKNYHANKKKCYAYYKNYWKNTTEERKLKRKKKKTQYTKNFRKKHPGIANEYYARSKQKWTNGIDCKNPKIWKKAEYIAKQLIQKIGYKKIFQPKFAFFYFDYVAQKKNGKYTVFQVTTLRNRAIKKKHLEFANYFGWDFYIIHIKPSFDYAYVTKIKTSPIPKTKTVTYSSFRGIEYKLL